MFSAREWVRKAHPARPRQEKDSGRARLVQTSTIAKDATQISILLFVLVLVIRCIPNKSPCVRHLRFPIPDFGGYGFRLFLIGFRLFWEVDFLKNRARSALIPKRKSPLNLFSTSDNNGRWDLFGIYLILATALLHRSVLFPGLNPTRKPDKRVWVHTFPRWWKIPNLRIDYIVGRVGANCRNPPNVFFALWHEYNHVYWVIVVTARWHARLAPKQVATAMRFEGRGSNWQKSYWHCIETTQYQWRCLHEKSSELWLTLRYSRPDARKDAEHRCWTAQPTFTTCDSQMRSCQLPRFSFQLKKILFKIQKTEKSLQNQKKIKDYLSPN
jgi:hypothetical protein